MRKLIGIICLTWLFTQGLMAQDVLVKINGDSLRGKIDFAKDRLGLEYVIIRDGRKKENVKLVQTRLIQTESGDIIRPVEFNGKYKFGKQIHLGYLSYYKVTGEDVSELFTEDLLTKMDGSNLVVGGRIGFKGRVSKFLEDCYEVSYAVRQKKYDRNSLLELTKAYNGCVNKNGLMSADAIEQKAEQLRIEKAAETKISKTLEQKLADFSTLLEYSDKVANKPDVTAMFNDLAGKLRRNENLPNYLKNGLNEAIKADPELVKLLANILKK